VKSPKTRLEKVIRQFKVYPQHPEDDVIDQDLILYWGQEKRIVTGSDILGRLLRGIVIECELASGCEIPVPPSQPGIVRRRSLRRRSKEGKEQRKE
jgi:hypothetical protein